VTDRLLGDGCSTPFGITEVGAREGELTHGLYLTCSTPFGITEVGAGGKLVKFSGDGECSTPFGITEVGARTEYGSRTSIPRKCSTPFGITEVGALGVPRLDARLDVLNAFRHHRGGRPADEAAALTWGECSTPFGITEVGASAALRRPDVAAGCSTPFGITEVGAAARGWAVAARYVLNAFRHHRGGRIERVVH